MGCDEDLKGLTGNVSMVSSHVGNVRQVPMKRSPCGMRDEGITCKLWTVSML